MIGRTFSQPTSFTSARMHNSLTVVWWPAEFVPKRHYDAQTRQTHWRMNLFQRRTIPAGSLIHESAFQRGQEYQLRLPSGAVRVNSLPLP